MKILAIDDELFALTHLQKDLSRSGLPIEQIFTARSAQEARQIVSENQVDIVLCDIEMPQENGLDFLLWLSHHYEQVVSIVVTCHADFQYVQNALRLNVVDYLVKPVLPDVLESALKKAIETKKRQEQLHIQSEYGKYWVQNRPALLRTFLFDALTGVISITEESLDAAAQSRGIALPSEKWLMVLMRIHEKTSVSSEYSSEKRHAILRIASTTLTDRQKDSVVLEMKQDSLLALVPLESELPPESLISMLSADFKRIVQTIEIYFPCRVYCYLGTPGSLVHCLGQKEALFDLARNTFSQDQKIVNMLSTSKTMMRTAFPNMNILTILLLEGSFGQAKQHILDMLEDCYTDADYIRQFYQEFLSVFSVVLRKNRLSFSDLFPDSTNTPPAPEDLHELNRRLMSLIDRLAELNGDTTSVATIKAYIKNNLDGHLTREVLGEHVHMNPDYLNRIFKQETGLSLHDFIVEQRLELAKELLINTHLKISAVALNVGCTSFSQFSKIFKEATGLTPKQYQRKFQKK